MSRRRIFDIIQIGNRSDTLSRSYDLLLVVNILLNIFTLFCQTFDELDAFTPVFQGIEMITIAFFVLEYLLRIWTAQYLFQGKGFWQAAGMFCLSFDGIVELLTILPFAYLSGFVAFRMLRVVRIFHLFRINATYDSFNVIKGVLYEKRNQLVSSIFIISVLMLSASLFMYSAEHDAQPEVFRNGFSGIWWSVSTLLTVGYGDIYPVTPVGKALAIVIAFLGVGAVAIPTGIISAGFVEHYTRIQSETGSGTDTFHLQTIVIDIDSAWIGRDVEDIRNEYGKIIALIHRGEKTIRPDPTTTIRMADVVAVYPDT